MDISVLIPAYKDLNKIPDALELLRFGGEFEVIVAGDLLKKEDKEFLKRMGVRLDCSDRRRGKARALNHAFEKARGELVVFMDSDTRPEDDGFLEKIWNAYRTERFEIGTGRLKVEGSSPLEKAINVEYMFMNGAMMMGNVFKKSVPINGAFIIVNREAFAKIGKFSRVIVEDFNLGFKANTCNLKFFYMKNVGALTSSPKKLREWLVQRKRWVMGASQSIGMTKKDIARNLPASTAALTSYYPVPSLSIISAVFATVAMSQVNWAYVLSMTAVLTTGLMLLMNKVLDWGISLWSGLSYLLWYGPLWSAFTVLMLVYFFFRKEQPEDWVV